MGIVKKSLEWALLHAVDAGNMVEAERIRKIHKRRKALGLRVPGGAKDQSGGPAP